MTKSNETHTCTVQNPAITPATCMMCDAELGTYCPECQPWGDTFCSQRCEGDYYNVDEN